MNSILNAAIWASDKYTAWLGDRFAGAAELLEDTAETLRFLAALTRATP